ncbi:GH92 family glycosyl hydrolase [Asticcacaulis sp. 201]|uniref:GH92 family glycosyl hydrolase n=1 Tax=Asticcacaulis sp. 201 TaxID=3028787 RepID=UPI0029163FB9|nr:GH92 family glycosyl hydrolase [Asticcacaulis sp. 201]MDV6331203.1 GH92 family glycosyl hydrolase [Asticcacaulis sp. 201]
MFSRRTMLASMAASGLVSGLGARNAVAQPAATPRRGSFVDPMIGTGGHGHVYPGPSRPFGMIQLSPDTDNARWDACSGYYIADETLLGFSHTHLSGTGAIDLMDLLVVPRVGEVRLSAGTLTHPEGSYRTRMSHEHEEAVPGYYSVVLPEHGIRAELTATTLAGLHRYTFSAGQDVHILLDWQHGARDDDFTRSAVYMAHIEQRGPDTLVGTRMVGAWADGRIIHFALKVSRPFTGLQLYSNDQPVTGANRVDGDVLKAALHYGTTLNEPLMIKVAVSAVDIDGALNNLETDLPGWDFEGVRRDATAAWETELSRIHVTTPSDADRKTFYTSLYHAHLAPTLFTDADGRYRGMDSAVHTAMPGYKNYSTYSLWDVYRTWYPLMTLIAPDRAAAFAQNLIDQGAESPYGPVIWPLQGRETHCMIGWHSDSIIAEALSKHLTGVDAKKAWAVYKKLAFETESLSLNDYRSLGYVSADKSDQSVSRTLEYCHDDWSMARIAELAGDSDSAARLRARSKNYKNVMDMKSQFARPRLADGSWAEPFVPNAMGHNSLKWWDFTESNSWQATFLNQHDIYNFIALFGGDAGFEAKLDALFTAPSDLPPDAPPDMSGLIGQYVHGNEPSHHIAYLYAYCGAHHKTQARVRMLLKTQYRPLPDGLSGNEDCGQMSAWYIMSALGFYPVDPVSLVYVFGSPLFSKVEIPLADGKMLHILAPKVNDSNIYIQSITWNGRLYSKSWISHHDLIKGGELVFNMGPAPNLSFGAAPADRPPSFVTL